MASIGTNVIGNTLGSGYTILATNIGYHPNADGVTIDWANVTAEASTRTLASGYITTVGEKVIPAGTVIYRHSSGQYRVAASGTTLVVGETYLVVRDLSNARDLDHVGDVTDSAQVLTGRILVGGSLPTLANVKTALPAVRFKRV